MRMLLYAAAVAAASAVAAVSWGCGRDAPPAGNPTRARSPVAVAERTHEYPGPAPRGQPAAGGAATQAQAIRAFAELYVNWTATTVSANMRSLAAQSVGQARSAMQLAAAQTAQDYELQRGGIANRGTVEAIAPLAGDGGNRFVVVTRELTTAANSTEYQGLRPAWHVAIATVVAVGPGRWALSGWQPEN